MMHVGAMIFILAAASLWTAIAGSSMPVVFHIEPAASRVWFDADARLFSFQGQTQKIRGSFTLWQRSPPQISHAKVSIDAAGLQTGNRDRDADMHRDFLEVERFPTIAFEVTDVLTPRPVANGTEWDVVLQGTLTVHGISRDVQVPTTVDLRPDRLTARGQIHLDMRDYNIRVPRLLFIPMKSEVLVGFEVVARPQPS